MCLRGEIRGGVYGYSDTDALVLEGMDHGVVHALHTGIQILIRVIGEICGYSNTDP